MNLIDVTRKFKTDDDCLDYLEAARWPSGVCCIECGSLNISKITREADGKVEALGDLRLLFTAQDREAAHLSQIAAKRIEWNERSALRCRDIPVSIV